MQILRQRDVIGAHQREPARNRPVPRAAEEDAVGVERVQRVAHPHRRAAGRDARAARRSRRRRPKRSTRRPPAGEDFGRLAVSFSNAQTALEGGSLGWRKGPELPTFLAEVIAGMKTGDVTKPMRTPSGFHIIKLNEMRGNTQVIVNQVHARHILIKPNELQDDATVQQKLVAHPRPHPQQGRELHRRRLGGLGRSGLRGRRRRPRLGRPRHLRAGIRKAARAAAAG